MIRTETGVRCQPCRLALVRPITCRSEATRGSDYADEWSGWVNSTPAFLAVDGGGGRIIAERIRSRQHDGGA